MSIYDRCESQSSAAEDVIDSPILFSLWVMRRALDVWPKVGQVALEPKLVRPEAFLKRDALSGKLTVYTEGREEPPTDLQIRTLEPAAVWDPEHVVDRVVDHYEGRPNRWLESLRNRAMGR